MQCNSIVDYITIKIIRIMATKRVLQYKENKSKKVGEMCVCPICGDNFIKKQWQQAFDSITCKDKYWNNKKDRHDKGYYRDYNMAHPERYRRIGLEPLTEAEIAWNEFCWEEDRCYWGAD